MNDSRVDAVYIATPHPLQREHALAAISAGRHVLVEKPIAMSGAEPQEITQAGVAAGVLVMEAMWTRYLPQSYLIRSVSQTGSSGRSATCVRASDSCRRSTRRVGCCRRSSVAVLSSTRACTPSPSRHLSSATPTRIHAAGELATNGVDASAEMLLVTPRGRALLSTSLTTQLPTRALISGTNGSISVAAPFFAPSDVTVNRGGAWDGEKGVYSSDLLAASGDGMGLQSDSIRRVRG